MRVIIFLVLWSFVMYAGPQEELFLRAGNFYKAGNAQEALLCYEQIANKGPAVWYNMGNCAYVLDDMLHAFVYWRRAQRGASKHLYQKSVQLIFSKIYQHDPTFLRQCVEWLKSLVVSVSFVWLQLLVLICFYSGWFFWNDIRRTKMRMFLASMLLGLSGFLLYSAYDMRTARCAIIVQETPVLSGPNLEYTPLDTIGYMAEVLVLDEACDWYKIKNTNALVGWIPRKSAIEL